MLLCACMPAQTTEVTTKESAVTFQSTSNLVSVPVVVRDRKGQALGTLGREDFQLFDNGKLQSISKFTLEKMDAPRPVVTTKTDQPANAQTLTPANTDGIPQRYVAFLFDDVHIKTEDLVYVREAARRRIDAMQPTERAAIYTTSGFKMTDFTADHEVLHKTFASLPVGQGTARHTEEQNSCPPMTCYMGDQIQNHNDQTALDAATRDTIACMQLTPHDAQLARSLAQGAARVASQIGDRDTLTTLDALRLIVAKLAVMPGQRSLILISPGFLVTSDRLTEETDLINRAIRAGIVIGALDARGLYTLIPGGSADAKTVLIETLSIKATYARSEAMQQEDVMGSLAEGTGGTFFKGNNDFDEGFKRVAAMPEYIYLLGFSPTALKMDGAYHTLKVTLKDTKGMSLQVRKGYFAAKYSTDPKQQARQQLEEAFFSLDEIHDLPATLQTQYFKKDDGSATLSAVATIDVKKLTFRKEDDRNRNDVTIQTGLFDDGGNFVTGLEKIVQLRLLDQTLQNRLGQGIGVKSSFDVHPGAYVVRMVVRDAEGQSLAAQSTRVEIP